MYGKLFIAQALMCRKSKIYSQIWGKMLISQLKECIVKFMINNAHVMKMNHIIAVVILDIRILAIVILGGIIICHVCLQKILLKHCPILIIQVMPIAGRPNNKTKNHHGI